MEKKAVTTFNLEAAFKALDEIDIPTVKGADRFKANRVNLHERLSAKAAHEVLVEDYFDVSNGEELNAAQEEREAEIAKAKLARIEKIVDLDAESEDDILPSYVGKVIIQCPQCMTLFYKSEEDIEKSEETPDVVNINEICQHCGNSSGYSLVGKVGNISEDEADNFDADSVEVSEDELNLDFPEEGEETSSDEAASEETGDETTEDEGSAEISDEELDSIDSLDFGAEEEENEEEDTNESLHNSKFQKGCEKGNPLNADRDTRSKHMSLYEEASLEEPEADAAVEESLFNSKVQKDAEKGSAISTSREQKSKNLSLHEEMEDEEIIEDFDEASYEPEYEYVESQYIESINNSKVLNKSNEPMADGDRSTHLSVHEDILDGYEDFDDSFDEYVTEYLKEVYANAKSYSSTRCVIGNRHLMVEGVIKFNSGAEKATRFTFSPSLNHKNSLILRGVNESFSTSDKPAFKLLCKKDNGKLITEKLGYHYSIEGSKVSGLIKK